MTRVYVARALRRIAGLDRRRGTRGGHRVTALGERIKALRQRAVSSSSGSSPRRPG